MCVCVSLCARAGARVELRHMPTAVQPGQSLTSQRQPGAAGSLTPGSATVRLSGLNIYWSIQSGITKCQIKATDQYLHGPLHAIR